MIPIHFLVALPWVACQFPMSVEPDVAFGEQNDRFDMSGMFEGQQRYFDTHGLSDARRSGAASWPRPHVPPRRRFNSRFNPFLHKSKHSRRDDNWNDEMANLFDDNPYSEAIINSDMFARAQESRRIPPVSEGSSNIGRAGSTRDNKKEREMTLFYSLPIKIKVVDAPEGQMIKAINIL